MPVLGLPLLVWSALFQEPAPQRWKEDPAPPEVHALAPASAPEPRESEGLTIHRAPRPRAAGAVDEDWPMFLGPRRDGHTRETGLAVDWPAEGPPLVWELRIGRGFATPVVAAGRLVVTHRLGAEIHVDCLDPRSGRRFWRFTLPCEYSGRYISNDGPRSTPAIEDGSVWVHGVEGQLVCLELATGRVRWQRDTHREFGVPLDFFGIVASPLVHGELLIQNIGTPGPCVAAFDKHTGRLRWGAGPAWGPSCASPVLATVEGHERLFVLAGGESRPPTGGLVVLDPASGLVEHTYPFRSKIYESVTGSSPVVAGKRVFMSAAYGTGSAGLEAQGEFRELWKNRHIGLQFSSAIHADDALYLIDGVADRAGALVALDPASGEELSRTELVWDEELPGRDGAGAPSTRSCTVGEGSLLAAEGRLLCLGDNGHLLWLAASPSGARVLARARLFDANESWTPPVVVGGLCFVRQTKVGRDGSGPRLLCYDLRAGDSH